MEPLKFQNRVYCGTFCLLVQQQTQSHLLFGAFLWCVSNTRTVICPLSPLFFCRKYQFMPELLLSDCIFDRTVFPEVNTCLEFSGGPYRYIDVRHWPSIYSLFIFHQNKKATVGDEMSGLKWNLESAFMYK